MKISIITVCFNSEKTIADTIESVLGQCYSDLEYIIVDGGSKDSTLDILKKYPRITKFTSEPDNGIFDAMNKGLKMATGEVVGFLNSDDFYIDNMVLNKVSDSLSDPNIDASFADLIYVDSNYTNKIIRYWKSSNYVQGIFKRGWVPAHPTFFCKKAIFDKFGAFDISYENASDFELIFRFIEINKISTAYIPLPLVKMRMGGVSNSSLTGIFKQNLKIALLLRSTYPDMFLSKFIFLKVLSRVRQFFSAS